MAQFDLSGIFKKAFGYDAPTTDANKIHLAPAPNRRLISKLGQPFYMNDLSSREFFLPVVINEILVPFAVMGMTWKKTIISTAMPERGGSVKELISIDDYLFNLKGILINETNDFPDDGVMQLADLFRINAAVSMRCVLSDIVLSGLSDSNKSNPYGHNVVIKKIDWPTVSGVEHAKPFEMELESDMIFDLTIA